MPAPASYTYTTNTWQFMLNDIASVNTYQRKVSTMPSVGSLEWNKHLSQDPLLSAKHWSGQGWCPLQRVESQQRETVTIMRLVLPLLERVTQTSGQKTRKSRGTGRELQAEGQHIQRQEHRKFRDTGSTGQDTGHEKTRGKNQGVTWRQGQFRKPGDHLSVGFGLSDY